jgi:dimethylhistidine N-methyltransferase
MSGLDDFAFYNNKYMESVFLDAEWSDVLFPSLPHNDPGEMCPGKMANSTFYKNIVSLTTDWVPKAGLKWSDNLKYCEIGGACGRTFYELLKAQPNIREAVLCEPSGLIQYAKQFLLDPRGLGEVPILQNDGSRTPKMLFPEAVPPKVGDGVDLYFHNDVCTTLAEKYRGYFQVMTCLNVVDRHPNPRQLIAEIEGLLAPGGVLVLASPMDFTEEFTPGDRVHDLRELVNESWTCISVAECQYDWRVTSRYSQRFSSQVVCLRKAGGKPQRKRSAMDEAVVIKEDFIKEFGAHVAKGLSLPVKHLSSLYFYDDIGSDLYAKITECEDYYLTRVEYSLLNMPENQKQISDLIVRRDNGNGFNLVELGAGDGRKTTLLLNHFLQTGLDFAYLPIDISAGALVSLEGKMRAQFNLNGKDDNELPILSMRSLHADNIQGLGAIIEDDQKELYAKGKEGGRTNVVLFLGSSIGNMNNQEALQFLQSLQASLQDGDILILGFDLRKAPELMIAAYSDREGITAAFNYNLLRRMNQELGADFDVDQFKHHCTYCPRTNEMQSWLVSQKKQTVNIKSLGRSFDFEAWECMQTESSFKYTLPIMDDLVKKAGFDVAAHLHDRDAWMCVSLCVVRK